MSGKSIAATLAVLASIATILGFLLTVGQGTSPPPPSPPSPVTFTSPMSTPPQSSPAYPSSAEQSFLATCENYTGLAISHCQCDLTWVEANYTYSTPSPAMELTLVEQAENNALCP